MGELALDVHGRQGRALAALDDRPAAPATARSESAAALLAPNSNTTVSRSTSPKPNGSSPTSSGHGPRDAADEQRLAADRDDLVLRHLPHDLRDGVDLRNPANVKSLLRRAGIEVHDTRAWRLERLRDEHPVVDALLVWRKAERIATTFGYRWLDEHVGDGPPARLVVVVRRRCGPDDRHRRPPQPARRTPTGRRR